MRCHEVASFVPVVLVPLVIVFGELRQLLSITSVLVQFLLLIVQAIVPVSTVNQGVAG